jgi:hypothetical protein
MSISCLYLTNSISYPPGGANPKVVHRGYLLHDMNQGSMRAGKRAVRCLGFPPVRSQATQVIYFFTFYKIATRY